MKKKANLPKVGERLLTSGGNLVVVVKVPSVRTGMYYYLRIVENLTRISGNPGVMYSVGSDGRMNTTDSGAYDIAHHIPKTDVNKMSRRY